MYNISDKQNGKSDAETKGRIPIRPPCLIPAHNTTDTQQEMKGTPVMIKWFRRIPAAVTALLITALIPLQALAADGAPRKALPVSAGIQALRDQFEPFQGSKADRHALDSMYYSPVGENDRTKYPLVIFLHGIGHGKKPGSQLNDSDFPYWSCSEFQARFSDAGGAFILMPRCPENKHIFWGESLIGSLRALIVEFIAANKENIDTSRVAISGSSAGGAMVWLMLESFPGMFSCAFPLASTTTPKESSVEKAHETAIWILASKKDPAVNYNTSTLKTWNDILETNDRPEDCRLTTFMTVYKPDGTKSSDNHHLASVITYDLHTLDEGLYPEAETVDGLGNTVDLRSPNGLISWISSVKTNGKGASDVEDAPRLTFLALVKSFMRNRLFAVVHFFQAMLGL